MLNRAPPARPFSITSPSPVTMSCSTPQGTTQGGCQQSLSPSSPPTAVVYKVLLGDCVQGCVQAVPKAVSKAMAAEAGTCSEMCLPAASDQPETSYEMLQAPAPSTSGGSFEWRLVDK